MGHKYKRVLKRLACMTAKWLGKAVALGIRFRVRLRCRIGVHT